MSSMIHGIRILSKIGCHLTFKTYLIYSDWKSLPRTHGFALLFLSDSSDYWELSETVFEKDLQGQKDDLYKDDGHIALSKRYIKKLVVSDFQNVPVKPEFLEYTWHYLDDAKKFHFEEHLPQATYELEVSDPKWIEHIPEGAVWETTACDFLGPYWHLETPGEKGKFYKIFRSIAGAWILNYGKKGSKGRTTTAKYMNTRAASQRVEEKLKKGYELIYQNFNTDWNIESDLEQKSEQQKRDDQNSPDSSAFFKALEKHDFATIEKFLSGNLDPNTLRGEWGNFPLEVSSVGYSATENSYKITRLLLEKGADPNVGQYGHFFPGLCYSFWDNPWQEKIIQLFLDHGVDISLVGSADNHSVLQVASGSGRIELLKRCLDADLDVKHRSLQGHTAMHYAASTKRNTKEIIDLLLEKGANINDNNGSWGTPLHFAATNGTPEAVSYLVEKGADIHARDSSGKQPIHLVAEFGEVSTFDIFMKLGADGEAESYVGIKPIELIMGRMLGISPKVNEIALGKLKILNSYKKVSLEDPKITDALFGTSRSKKKLTKREESGLIALVNLGFDPFQQDSKGVNLFIFSAKTQGLDLLKACLSVENANLNLQDEYGWTAFHYAKATKNEAIINEMLQSDYALDQSLASKKQRKIMKVKYPRGTTAESMD